MINLRCSAVGITILFILILYPVLKKYMLKHIILFLLELVLYYIFTVNFYKFKWDHLMFDMVVYK